MVMTWFLPLGVLVGLWGLRTSLRMRHTRQVSQTRKPWDWCVMLVLGWVPLACWFLAQFVSQD